jgi:hypothetical protein
VQIKSTVDILHLICFIYSMHTSSGWCHPESPLFIPITISVRDMNPDLLLLRLSDMLTLVIALTPEAVYLTFQMSRHEKDGTWSNWHQAYYIILSRRKAYGRCKIWSLFIMKYLLVQYWLVHLPNSRRSGFIKKEIKFNFKEVIVCIQVIDTNKIIRR